MDGRAPAGRLADELIDLPRGDFRADRLLLGAHLLPFRGDDMKISEAQESQRRPQIGVLEIERGERPLTQVAAAEKLGVAQPKVSALVNYRLDGFSVERLMVFLTALDRDVEIVIRKKPRSRAGRISVAAA